MAKAFDPASATDEELAAEATRLAGIRTAVRLAQNAVAAEQETRSMIRGLSGAARESVVKRLGLSGGVNPDGATSAAEEKNA